MQTNYVQQKIFKQFEMKGGINHSTPPWERQWVVMGYKTQIQFIPLDNIKIGQFFTFVCTDRMIYALINLSFEQHLITLKKESLKILLCPTL